MTRVVAFLRAVNLAGRSRLGMADLRQALGEAGYEQVSTYLQSGNVILDTGAEPADVARGLEAELADRFELRTRVIVRTGAELADVIGRNPFLNTGTDHAKLHTVFLDSAPEAERIGALDPQRSPQDRFEVSGKEVFIEYPHGQGRSKLGLDYIERQLGVAGTGRNWNTVTRIHQLLTE